MSLVVVCSATGSMVAQTEHLISQNRTEAVLNIPDLRLWSPSDPFLYDLELQLVDSGGQVVDVTDSYFGAREITCESDQNGHHRLFLNGEPVFHLGLLDQGWWPEGLFTAPTDEALKFDIEATLAMGFNTIRKHVKVEPARWYWHADRLGVLVWQDMPSTAFDMVAFGKQLAEGIQPEDMEWDLISPGNDREGFLIELDAMIDALESFPSIVVWVPFNEAWGQHDTDHILTHVMERDPSRLVDGPSGWTDTGTGHMRDHHLYQDAEKLPAHEDGRATVYGEFGGLSLFVDGHVMVEKGWGYTKTETAEDLLASYTKLLNEITALIPEGLAGVIYTQTTDVESEINGLLTYDRNYKIDPDILCSLHTQILDQ
jgi:beta-galactosidase/beta-glucuronidase